jgi:hypothetical protein
MIPIRTKPPPNSLPVLTWVLLAANFGVFFYQIQLGKGVVSFIQEFAIIPQFFSPPRDPQGFGILYPFRTLITSIFLHGGWLHLLGNMLILWVFGGLVEDRLGHLRFFIFYVLAGMVSGLAHVIYLSQSKIPCLGASGAIAAILGAGLVLFPRVKVVTLIPIPHVFIIRKGEWPAFVFLFLWFIGQVLLAHRAHFGGVSADEVQIAVMAHLGGFAFGFLGVWFFRKK